jgi:hypothetical protein
MWRIAPLPEAASILAHALGSREKPAWSRHGRFGQSVQNLGKLAPHGLFLAQFEQYQHEKEPVDDETIDASVG